MTRPLLIVGYVGAALGSPALFQPGQPVIFVEEPDVVRKREARAKIDAKPGCDLIEWEFHLPGKADEFFHTHRDLDPAAIIPLTEYATPFAARLAERWGLPGAGYGAAMILRDKQLLRQVTRAAGIANPESVQVRSPADVVAFMLAHPGPIVLKPANRQASVGTQVIRGLDEVEQAWANCVAQDEGVFVPDRAMELRMLAEQFVDGHEYSVEMLVRQGEPLFFNVTGKQLFPGSRPVELAHIVPADIPGELTELLGEQTRRVIDAAGFRDGIVHCEWIVADGVPYVVECAGRFAGDGIIELIQRAYPVELELSYYLVLQGLPPKDLPCEAKGGAAVRFLSIPQGVVEDVRGVEEAANSEGVFMCDVSIAKGDNFQGLRSSWDRVGDLMVTGDSPADALRLAEAAVARIQVDVVPAELAATTS
ncbi:biotin carboxylase [Kibdelosporangium banguiense]|uniref:Biotin carboxylase n=1 Tax=Kibdelosporangium banguiense TaxID=1365924 RepID=A0ABS4TPP8_9PSEU|nr:ATP-grasp domain-containing protein [Kibdelosporangium banguiense]MBP2326376.1 biotin carboxylase [Kibdelosporangium banguiense]